MKKKYLIIAAFFLAGFVSLYSTCLFSLPAGQAGLPARQAGLPHSDRLNNVKKWFILLDYNPSRHPVSSVDMSGYDMAMLDPDSHPPFAGLKDTVILIAYVSLGEAETYRSYWEGIKEKPWIIGENPNWKENYYVDVRNEEWRSLIISEVIPEVMKKGFAGIMMDTLDTSYMLEATKPEIYRGSDKAMSSFVEEIHRKYPELLLISNNGFSILEDIAPCLSGMLVEDIYMMVDFEKQGYKKVPEEDRRYKVSILERLMKKYRLPVFVIDYVSQGDKGLAKRCIKQLRRLGFKPYIAERDLNRIYTN